MRSAIWASAVALGLFAVPTAQAGPIGIHHSAATVAGAAIVEVAGGCGPGYHPASWRDRWGRWHRRCVPFRHWH